MYALQSLKRTEIVVRLQGWLGKEVHICVYVFQADYLYVYHAMEAYCAEEQHRSSISPGSSPHTDRLSLSNHTNMRGSFPPGILPDLPPPAVFRSSSRNSAIRNDSPLANRTSTL